MDNIISTGYDFVNNDDDAMDDNGHGTHVAGIAAATTDNAIGIAGVAWNCKILPVKVLQSNGYGTYSDVANGVTYAANNGAKVINLSLGGYAESYTLRDALENACSTAVIVASAGNDRTNLPFYPAAWDFVIGVGASDVLYDQENDIWYEGEAVFSNYGINADLYAPGVNICSTIPLFYPHSYSYASWNGTSMAAPFVTGTIALLYSHFPDWSNDLIHGQLINTSDEILSGEKLNVYNALITTSKPQLTLYSHTIIDTLQADDQNGIAGAGETIEMVFDIRNTWEQAYNVESTLSYHSYEDTSFITIIDSTANFGSISSYTHSKNETNPFKFYVKSNTPNNTNVYFDYKITCDNGVVVEETFNINVQRGFEVSGLINENIIWTKDKHYIVISNIIIDTGTTLTIEPGTEVRIDPNKSIIVKGTLNAVGTEIDSIVFTNNITSRWGTLSFQSGSTGILKYCRIESAGSGITAIGADSLLIQNNTICNNYVNGILFESTPQANIINNIIYSNLKYGISTEYSDIKIKDNLIFNNLRGGIWYRGDPTIIGNTIYNNSGWGINSIKGSPTITGNVFYNNSDGSIYWRFGYAEITYNTIFSNAYRSLSFDNINDAIVKYNNIISNNYYAIYYSNDYSVPPNINATHNFWGTINLDSINALIWDIYDDYEVGMVIYEPIETSPIIDAPGFLYQVEFNPPPPLGCETDTFNLIFSKPMDISIQPYVTFGLSEPYIQHIIEGDWVDSTHWQGTYEFGIMTGDGINHLRVTTAEDCEGMEIPKDTRFSFVIDATGASSVGFIAQAGIGKVDLEWNGQDMMDLMGYNMYRCYKVTDSTYSDTTLVNTSMITDTTYSDMSVVPYVHYYYMYKGISTDFIESDYSNPVSATPFDAANGDANGDLAVNVLDIISIVSYMIQENPQPFLFDAADMNNDGVINVLDIISVINVIIGYEEQIVAQKNESAVFSLFNNQLISSSSSGIAGIQFKISGKIRDLDISTIYPMELITWRRALDTLCVLAYCKDGNYIPNGNNPIFELSKTNNISFSHLVISDIYGRSINASFGTSDKLLIPKEFSLEQNYPNPFNASTTINYQLPAISDVTLSIYNVLGQKVYSQTVNEQEAGYYTYQWNGVDRSGHSLSSGLYIYQIIADEFSDSKKMIMLK